MAALGSILMKGGNNPSAHRTTQYEKLAQDPSDNEEEDDILFRNGNALEVTGVTRLQNGISKTSHTTSNGNQEGIEMDSMPTIHTARKLRSDVKVHLVRTGLLTRTRIACFIMVLLSGISLAFGFAFILPYFTGKGGRSAIVISRPTASWTHILPELGTDSAVRLVDVDGDGKQDVLFGTMEEFGFRVSTIDMMQSLCKQKNLSFPCVGKVLALRGTDGAELWRLTTYSGVTDFKCDVMDVNNDGRHDCIATGRMGTMVAFDIQNGTILWHADPTVLNPAWNVYAPLILPDLDLDGVPEILIAHGGDDAFPHAKLVAHKLMSRKGAGRLILLSGKTGKSLGRVFEMARKRQTYMSPILHTTADGSTYVLFGTGESQVPGSLFMISVPDLYRYVRGWNKTVEVPNTKGAYKSWSNLICDDQGLCEIFSSSMKGLMVPPVCVDLTGDGIRDIVMAAYDGTVMVRHGDTMKEVWKVTFSSYEAHSAPAPAYFNDDDTLDLMLHLNHGTWPRFNHSKVIILDGNTGDTLWSLQTDQHEMTSDLVVRTTAARRDAYVFRVQGREGKTPYESLTRRKRDTPGDGKGYVPKQRSQDYDFDDYRDYEGRPDYNYHYGNSYSPYRQYQRYHQQAGNEDEGYGPQRGSDSLQHLWTQNEQQDRPPTIFDGRDGSYYQHDEDVSFGGKIPNSDDVDRFIKQNRKYGAPVDHLSVVNTPRTVTTPLHGAGPAVSAPPTPAPYVSPCENDLDSYNTEVFLMDRTLMNSPLKVTEIPATRYRYNLTSNDKKMLESIRSAGSSRGVRAVPQGPPRRRGLAQGQPLGQGQTKGQSLPLGQTQVPLQHHSAIAGLTSSRRRLPPNTKGRGRGQGGILGQPKGQVQGRLQEQVPQQPAAKTLKRPAAKAEPAKELCTIMSASEMVTGTLGDVDGDGSLDLVLMFDREAAIRAADGTYIRSEYVTEVTKVNLVDVLTRRELVPMNVTIPHPETMTKTKDEKSIFQVHFETVNKQPWMSYLGTHGDSIYKT